LSLSSVAGFILEFLFPFIAWAALIYLAIRWLLKRWESKLAAERSFRLRFPLSSMVFLSRKIVIEELINDPQIQEAIAKQAKSSGQQVNEIEKQLRQKANEMVPAFKAVFYFSIGYWLARTMLLTMYKVKLVTIPSDKYAKIGRDATVVLVMNHRSNIDVLLVNFLLCRHSTVSHAAGEWARLWPLHHLVRMAGNYVVDRDSNDPLYRLLLKRYVQMAVARGIHLGIFPEGSLTRDGLIQPLNFGLLNYVSTASWAGYDRDVVFIPASFNYDHVPEQYRLVFEDSRAFKDRSKFYVAYSGIKFCVKFLLTPLIPRHRRFGWACASFGEPVSLKAWQKARGIELKSLPSKQRRKYVESLGKQLMDSSRQMIPVLPIHLVATALLERPESDWPEISVRKRVSELQLAVETTGASTFNYDCDPETSCRQALSRLERQGTLTLSKSKSGESIFRIEPSQIPMLEYYANSISHHLEQRFSKDGADKQIINLISSSDNKKNYLRIIAESYDRVRQPFADRKDFFERFYEIFLASSPEIAEKFSDSDMEQLQLHLRQSLEHMVDFFIIGKPSERIRQIAQSHNQSGYDIPSNFYDFWLDSLMATVKEYDSEYDSRVDLSWRELLAPGIAYMRNQHLADDAHDLPAIATPEAPPIEQEGIARWIDHWGKRTPQKLAISTADRQVSYREFSTEVRRLAAGLHHRIGIGADDRIAFLGSNRLEFLTLTFACARLGAALVPINFRLGRREQQQFLHRAEAKAVFVEEQYSQVVEEAQGSWQLVRLDQRQDPDSHIHYKDLLTVPTSMKIIRGTMDSPLFIVFTSGSTGDPKGAVLTQGATHWNALNSAVMHDLNRNDHILTTLPFFHVGGINIQTLPAFHVGATVTLSTDFDAQEFVKFVEKRKPTLTVLVPTQMQQIMQLPNWHSANLNSLKAIATGSTTVSNDLIRAWANKGVPIIQIYGCTESGPIAIHQTVEDIGEGLGTVGYPSMYTDVKLTDKEGQLVAPGREGEICLRGPHLMSHYWRNEDATRSTFRDDWLLTGDLGYQDGNGRIQVVGRLKRLIISGGENVHPGEVEQVLTDHAAISEAAVIATADLKWGEVPVALIVLHPEAEWDENSIRLHLSENLGRYKHPRRLIQTAELPRTALGKIDYPKVSTLVSAE